jgi:hypothetical protein
VSKRGPYKLSRAGGYFSMEREVYKSPAFQSLSAFERVVLLHLLYYFVPNKCEDIAMSGRRLGNELGINKDTAAKSLKRLEIVGLIKTTAESMWMNGFSRSYRLTFMSYQNKMATDEWKRFDGNGPNKSVALTHQKGRGSSHSGSDTTYRPTKPGS